MRAATPAGDAVTAVTGTHPAIRRRVLLPLAAGVAVFLVNNLLLARLLTSLPGGTVLAATDMAAIALVAGRVRGFGVVTLIYAAYAALGILGHLGVDASTYVLHLPRILGAALVFDLVLLLGGFRRWALLLGVLPFAGIVLVGGGLPAREWLIALALAWAGLVAGMLIERFLPPRDRRPARD